ncbi:hypothetical protein CC80DRAFT_305636 [Byssothecium circinans]|uniref:SAP domain-containing protein n=1 Tax=Byssothecium circinans TaxID=147558 RepID=A0A6A5U364_9PLEO|nr:hypothetical protein CC80DRAFT_305636 [Byssothecium circinans]
MTDEAFILDMDDANGADAVMDYYLDNGDVGMNDGDNFSVDIGGDDDDFNPDDLDEDFMDGGDSPLQGYDDVHPETPDPDYNVGPAPKRARPAFFGRTTRAAERAALRAKEDNTFVLLEGTEAEAPFKKPSRIPGTFGRRNREKGSTLPAYHKKVSADLDSDDELMLDMREKGYSDRQIASKLAKDGRVRYDMKSISTRIQRIREAQAKHVDYLIKEGYMEWKMDDDQLLMRAYDLADIEIRYEMERLRAWRFRKVSDVMRRLNKNAVFSAAACSDRYISLIDGTAKIPSDQDDDPMARRAEMDAFIMQREEERDAERAAKENKEAEQQRVKEEAKMRQAEKSARTAAKRDREQQEKTNRSVLRATQNTLRKQQAAENARKKEERRVRIEADNARKSRNKKRTDSYRKTYGVAALHHVNKDTPDPRRQIPFEDLQRLCAERGLDVEGEEEELLDALREADAQLSSSQLKVTVKDKGMTPATSKMLLRYQLALWEARIAMGDDSEFEDEDGGREDAGAGRDDGILDFDDDEEDEEFEFE